MDKVRFACPRCQTLMQTGAEKVGYDVACPHCAHRFRLVESGDASTGSGNRVSADAATIAPTAMPTTGEPGSSGSGSIGSPPFKPSPEKPGYAPAAPVVSHFPASSPPQGFCCPYCQTTRPPVWKSEVSQVGWIVFAVLLVTTCVFCFVGLFIRDKYRICSQCRIRLG